MTYGVKSKTHSRYLEEFDSYGEAQVFTLKLREVWNNATMQIYEIDGLQEDILVEQFSPTKGVNYNKITTMKNYTEKRLESSRMFGKNTHHGMLLLEHIYKGEKYIVHKTAKNKVHIIPDKKLKEIIQQAVAEERARMVEEIKNTPIDTAHTYSSENADEYRTFDHGQESYKQRVLSFLDKPLTDKESK